MSEDGVSSELSVESICFRMYLVSDKSVDQVTDIQSCCERELELTDIDGRVEVDQATLPLATKHALTH
jgi:hypothetical protein